MLKNPNQKRLFKPNDLKDLFSFTDDRDNSANGGGDHQHLGAADGDGKTESAALFAGTDSTVNIEKIYNDHVTLKARRKAERMVRQSGMRGVARLPSIPKVKQEPPQGGGGESAIRQSLQKAKQRMEEKKKREQKEARKLEKRRKRNREF